MSVCHNAVCNCESEQSGNAEENPENNKFTKYAPNQCLCVLEAVPDLKPAISSTFIHYVVCIMTGP
jgi:hypothetical protein